MATNLEKFRGLLRELFQLDQADLDFGIYRVMNKKRDEIVRFLDNELLPQVQEAFSQYKSADKTVLQAELDKLVQSVLNAGMKPEDSPKVKELQLRLSDSAVDAKALEGEVFSHLYNFFRRYYDEGDFISLRRYKEGVYALPYEGEEIKLHWANADQYYIKSSETFRDYSFTAGGNRKVHFKLVAASTEQGNKLAPGKERRFFLASDKPVEVEKNELIIRFEYRPAEGKEKQDALNRETARAVLATPKLGDWADLLTAAQQDGSRTLLDKHLFQYTARNTFDYFVHKNLGQFLRRELDFYIKNEVMHLDDIDHESAPQVEQYLSQVRVIRSIAHKIIKFLEQLENFQKRLWLKKKFVVQTNYCFTLDRVPTEFYPEIAANEFQREEWVRLLAIDEVEAERKDERYTKPLTVGFLKAHRHLPVDTKHFDSKFKDRLLASIDDLDAACESIFIHSDNFQALQLLGKRFQDGIRCIYIDPPYNTGSSAILYKNNYKHSSFCTLMRDRLALARGLMRPDGAMFVSIDKTERTVLEHALDNVFGPDNHIEELIWTQATSNGQLPNYSTNHEYVEVYARDRVAVESVKEMFREPKPGYAEIMDLIARLQPDYPPCASVEAEIKKLSEDHITSYRSEVEAAGREWDDDAKRQDPWRGIYPYKQVEYRDKAGNFVPEKKARETNAVIWVWAEIPSAAPAAKQSPTTKDPKHHNYRYYKPKHPVTGKLCPHPRGGWKFPFAPDPDNPSRRSFTSLDADHRIVWGEDEKKVPRLKGFLHEVETNISTSVFYAYNDGEAELSRMFGSSGLFLSPKSSSFVRKFITQATGKSDWFMDFFGGSGSSGHALLAQNREDGGKRRQVLAEVGDHFEALLIPRIKKAIYSSGWDGGKPTDRLGMSAGFKYLRLESYEDALNNLELKRTEQQSFWIAEDAAVREQYVLSYMLDMESRGSDSLLNIRNLRNPDGYKLSIDFNGESGPVNVDLVETFNWLLGLTVKHMDVIRGVRVVDGTNPKGERVLVLWRNVDELDSDKLDKWFDKQGYNTQDMEYAVIYVNGDNNLENLRRADQTWKVRLIEEEFQRLMFDVQDV